MATYDDGGPAFPHTITTEPGGEGRLFPDHFGQGGMRLRDWFAGQVLIGAISNPADYGTIEDPKSCAEFCYQQADAMLKVRAA